MTAIVVQADAAMLPLPKASVDVIITSPPYFGLRSYTDGGEHYAGQLGSEPTPAEYIAALIACTREWMRVLKPNGSLFVNLGDKYVSDNRGSGGDSKRGDAKHAPAGRMGYVGEGIYPRKSLMMLPERYRIACLDQLGLIVRSVIVWDKPNGLPESVTDRVRRSHEDWVHLTLGPRYFADMDAIREQPARWDPPRPLGTRNKTPRHTAAADYTGWKDRMVSNNPNGKLPGSVWEIAGEPLRVPDELGVDHFAAFPTEWPRRIIKGWSPLGGTVLDPFGGTGTTALVASAHGRIGITVDRSADYCRIAEWRTTDPAQRAKALGVDKPPVQIRGQAELFTLDARQVPCTLNAHTRTEAP